MGTRSTHAMSYTFGSRAKRYRVRGSRRRRLRLPGDQGQRAGAPAQPVLRAVLQRLLQEGRRRVRPRQRPQQKKVESNVVIECTIAKSAAGDDEWRGTAIRYYSSSKIGNELGSVEYPTKLRRLANAVLGKTLQNEILVGSHTIPILWSTRS